MASLKGECSVSCKADKRSCWHMDCTIVRRFTTGRFLIENKHGYVRAASPIEMYFSVDEAKLYDKYNLNADDLELNAELERKFLRDKYKNVKFH